MPRVRLLVRLLLHLLIHGTLLLPDGFEPLWICAALLQALQQVQAEGSSDYS